MNTNLKNYRFWWMCYGLIMIAVGITPLLSMLLQIFCDLRWWGMYYIRIGDIVLTYEYFEFVYLFFASGLFTVYGIVALVMAFSKRVDGHSPSEGLTKRTTVFAVLMGVCIGVALTCIMLTVQLLSGPERYPLDDFCGTVGGVIGYAAAVVMLILYAHARRRCFTRKSVFVDIGMALFGLLAGSLFVSLAYEPISAWEEHFGYVNAFVEWLQEI